VVGKTKSALAGLCEQFREGRVRKRYGAVGIGREKLVGAGTIDMVLYGNKESKTHWHALEHRRVTLEGINAGMAGGKGGKGGKGLDVVAAERQEGGEDQEGRRSHSTEQLSTEQLSPPQAGGEEQLSPWNKGQAGSNSADVDCIDGDSNYDEGIDGCKGEDEGDGDAAESASADLSGEWWLSFFDLYPCTGRRHQLRKHLCMLDCPLLGDTKYGPKALRAKMSGAGRDLKLWSLQLLIHHPITGGLCSFQLRKPDALAAELLC
jgi:hypothetical protein